MISTKKSRFNSSKINRPNEKTPFRTLLHDRGLFSPDKTSIPIANYSKPDIRNDLKFETINTIRENVYHHRDSTRPKFLTQMIAYIKKEFAELGIEDSKPGCMERLQVYKTVFDFFMEEFKTYQPILSDIKNEYELNLQNALKIEDEYHLIKSKYSVLKYQSEKQIEELKQLSKNEYEEQINKLNREIERSKNIIRELNNEKELLEDKIDKLEIAEVNDERLTNRVYHLEQELERTNKYCSELIQQKDAELERLHDNVKSMDYRIFSLTNLNADLKKKMGKMVSIDLYHSVSTKLEKCEDELKDFKMLNENMIMQNIQKESLSFRSALKQNGNGVDDFEIDWGVIQSLCPGINVINYKRVIDKMDLNNIITYFIKKLNSNDLQSPDSKEGNENFNQDSMNYFNGLGLQSHIPKYLRYEGRIVNRMLNRRSCIMLINDIWKAKSLYEISQKKSETAKKVVKISLPEFLYLYLKKRFGAKKIIAEWGYNIHDACRIFGERNVICKVFLKILKDEYTEDVYYNLINVLNKLKKVFIHYDRAENNNEIKGYVSKKVCKQVFKQYWPNKSDEKIEALLKSVEGEQPENMYNYQYFIYNSYYEYPTVNLILDQEMKAREEYLNGLLDLLKSVSHDPKILGTDLLRIIGQYDQEKTKKEIDEYIKRGFNSTVEINLRQMVDKELFVKNLSKGVVMFGIDNDPNVKDIIIEEDKSEDDIPSNIDEKDTNYTNYSQLHNLSFSTLSLMNETINANKENKDNNSIETININSDNSDNSNNNIDPNINTNINTDNKDPNTYINSTTTTTTNNNNDDDTSNNNINNTETNNSKDVINNNFDNIPTDKIIQDSNNDERNDIKINNQSSIDDTNKKDESTKDENESEHKNEIVLPQIYNEDEINTSKNNQVKSNSHSKSNSVTLSPLPDIS